MHHVHLSLFQPELLLRYFFGCNAMDHLIQLLCTPVQMLWDYFFGCNNETLRLRETVPLTVHYRCGTDALSGKNTSQSCLCAGAQGLPWIRSDLRQPSRQHPFVLRGLATL